MASRNKHPKSATRNPQSKKRMFFYTASVREVAGGVVEVPNKALMRRGEVCAVLGISSEAVTQLVQSGTLRTVPQVS